MSKSLNTFISVLSYFDDGHSETIKTSTFPYSLYCVELLMAEKLLSGMNPNIIGEPQIYDVRITPLGSLKLFEFQRAVAANTKRDRLVAQAFALLLFILSSLFNAAIDVAKNRLLPTQEAGVANIQPD